MKRALIMIAVVALASLGLAACGGDDDDNETTAVDAATATEATTGGGGGAASTINVSAPADGSLAFDQKSLTAKHAGAVTIDFDNPASLSHDVVVEDSSGAQLGKTDLVAQGTASTTVDLQSGTYTFFCSVPGHRDGGMEGTLTVKSAAISGPG